MERVASEKDQVDQGPADETAGVRGVGDFARPPLGEGAVETIAGVVEEDEYSESPGSWRVKFGVISYREIKGK